MTNEKKWIFSKVKIIVGMFIISLFVFCDLCILLNIDFTNSSFGVEFACFLVLAIFEVPVICFGLKLILSYCAYNKKTLFIYSFFRCKKIDFKNINAVYETGIVKWTVYYWDKAENSEKSVYAQLTSGESKAMHGFFAALKAVHPCKIDCGSYKENYEGYDDILDVWQEANGYEGLPFNGTVYKTFVMPFEMENDDISPLRNVLLYEEGVWNEDEEEAYEGVIGLSEKDKIELIGVEEKSSDIKEFSEKWLLPEKASTKMCSLVEKADGYYKIFKNGEEFACEYSGVSAKYRVVKLGKKCALFSFHLEK